ncbi:anti-viral guanylate-binding protein [Tribonema minus]|uniref:Anti-viral guanylate-binding protein n=1 Tax=Tribonema minus TaxID=303371 RepID=A0A836CGS0_9STRA|nr:anti-viral guanylate-binding protein [Tribonema minus]
MAPDRAKPLRIVRTGDAQDNYSFTLEEENLALILSQVPDGMKVSVVSVVGAFRTGKSFLLSFFLRYLHADAETPADTLDWIKRDGEALREGNANLGVGQVTGGLQDPAGDSPLSFEWRGGQTRMTTGIWMWSEPFFRRAIGGETVAVLLVDTQGMFDNETSMGLTASIFGLSTLISSHQIYNVEKRIQEDHLQQLALFSEYGRMALAHKQDGADGGADASPSPAVVEPEEVEKPFQLLEFLVRDWQNFDDEDSISDMQKSMDNYLLEVIRDRDVKDLQETRDQIMACFEKVSCFGLCHPGMDVVKKNYDGSIDKIDATFRALLDAYVRRVFGNELEPKRIHGRYLTAPELSTYISAYVRLFHEGASFPEAKTLLEATSAANNSNAKFAALATYKSDMEGIAGPHSTCGYMQKAEFLQHHEECKSKAIALFNSIATMGRKAAVDACREELLVELASELERFEHVNESRRPFKDLEFFLVPMGIAAAAFVLRFFADASCSSWSTTCRRTADGLGHVYVAIFLFIAISSAGRIKQFIDHLRTVVPIILGNAAAGAGGGGQPMVMKKAQ